MTFVQVPRDFMLILFYHNYINTLSLQWECHSLWINWNCSNNNCKGDFIGTTSPGLETREQAKFRANEEGHYLGKDSLSNTGHIEGMLFQEEGKDGELFKLKVACYRKGVKTLT